MQVESLAKPQLRYKVDINAVENHLTGAAIVTDAFCLVVVEGSESPLPACCARRLHWHSLIGTAQPPRLIDCPALHTTAL